MNNEPVAWIIQDKYGRPALSWKGEPISYNAISVEQGDIPLYTHPPAQQWTIDVKVKTLTDEEIKDIGYKFGEMGLNLEMIRAILRKAQEK